MTETTQRRTATVYQFPADRRTRPGARVEASQPDVTGERTPGIVFGTGWYHDAAIAEARPAGAVVTLGKL